MIDYKIIKKNIEINGYHEIKNFFTEEKILELRKFVDKELIENNYQYFFLTSKTSKNNLLSDNNFFNDIEKILKNIVYEYGVELNKDEKLYKVLRVVTGKKSSKVSLDYHFDAHLLTLLIPIYIPNRINSHNGNLIIYKNLRKFHKNLLLNIIQKIFFQSRIFKYILNLNYFKNIFKRETLHLNPKNIYFFNGFRTLHTNLDIDPRDVRATLLIHFHDIFHESFLIKKNREIRIKQELCNIDKNKIDNDNN